MREKAFAPMSGEAPSNFLDMNSPRQPDFHDMNSRRQPNVHDMNSRSTSRILKESEEELLMVYVLIYVHDKRLGRAQHFLFISSSTVTVMISGICTTTYNRQLVLVAVGRFESIDIVL
ncbi:unnamed protein product [Malus baccata var. baccata]